MSAELLFPPGTTEVVHVETGHHGRTRLVTVLKQTKTQVVIAGHAEGVMRRFRADTGRELGWASTFGHHSDIYPATAEWRDRARRSSALHIIEHASNAIDSWRRKAHDGAMHKLPIEPLELIAEDLERAIGRLRALEVEPR